MNFNPDLTGGLSEKEYVKTTSDHSGRKATNNATKVLRRKKSAKS